MKKISTSKYACLEKLSNNNSVIEALAIDQRGSIKKMIASYIKESSDEIIEKKIVDFKKLVSSELTKYSSSILLDPEYGLEAAKVRDANAGLLLAYEKTGYDATVKGRLPDILDIWSVKRLKENGAEAIKFLLYYDIDEDKKINDMKQAFVERLGSECLGEDILFFLELVSYDATDIDVKSAEYAKVRPHKVNDMMIEFSKDRYNVDVLKVEVPVDMNYVEGYGENVVYTKEEAKKFFKEQSEATDLPFIFLSGGVSMDLFKKTLLLAKEADSDFNGVLCGRATWKDSVQVFSENGADACKDWLNSQGKENITALSDVLKVTATSWANKIGK